MKKVAKVSIGLVMVSTWEETCLMRYVHSFNPHTAGNYMQHRLQSELPQLPPYWEISPLCYDILHFTQDAVQQCFFYFNHLYRQCVMCLPYDIATINSQNILKYQDRFTGMHASVCHVNEGC